MVRQYPYILKVFRESESVFNQQTAEWESNVGQWETIGKCRDEINGSGAKITTEDSESYTYSAVIYAAKNIPMINKGAKVQVWYGDDLRLEGEVKRFGKEQLHTRIWL